jgi:hypothetical protein
MVIFYRGLLCATVAFQLIFFAAPANAGGAHIDLLSIHVNDKPLYIGKDDQPRLQPISVLPGTTVRLSFDAKEYAYGANDYKYMIFAILPADITPMPPAMSRTANWSIGYVLVGNRTAAKIPNERIGPNHYEIIFVAPPQLGQFQLVHYQISEFSDTLYSAGDQYGHLNMASGKLLLRLRRAMASTQMINSIGSIRVDTQHAAPRPTLYLRANGKVPYDLKLDGGISDKPLRFSWSLGPEVSTDIASSSLYRVRIEPSDDDFGPWMNDKSISYHFLPKGVNRFQVQAQVIIAGQRIETQPASFQFTLKQPFVAKPEETLSKGITVDGQTVKPVAPVAIAFNQLYNRSRALLVGISSFDDNSFASFAASSIEKDVNTLARALERNGFQITALSAPHLKRDEIMAALDGFINDTKPNDRLFLYFSTHGFSDPQNSADGFVATSNCSYSSPSANCIRLADLENAALRALKGRKARQFLIAVDSCFSGLGVISKSVPPPNFAMLATKPGAYMLTAGMADQTAGIDSDLGMSTFTYYLAQGLEGKAARYDRGGVITLSDLYTYVQYNVALRSQSLQIPMMGRLSGDGEMLFKPIGPINTEDR